ncbi:site-specific integrase [Pseudomonas reactans]|uniref:site-specific integrase n=1 Tax=Pseudomonas reactans TaxID=117680 RepID=UPI0015BF1FA8|nr:site-specific integrase [Pseudomonas reactans]NWA44707.1 site-specific integrase [Pseudomonas reactans]NWD32511.1 site-specific integrase [Pseudomonas reactans]
MADNLIQKKGESTWYVRLAVPVDVQKTIGCKVLIQSLKTGLRKEAMDARLPYLTQWKAEFAAARTEAQIRKENWRPELAQWGQEIDNHIGARFMAVMRNPSKKINELTPEENAAGREKTLVELYASANRLEALGVPGVVALLERSRAQMPPTAIERVQHSADVMRELMTLTTSSHYDLSPTETAEAQAIALDPAVHKPKSPITPARVKTYREFRESRGGAPKHVDQQVGKMERLSDFLKKEGLPLNFDTVDEWLKSLDRAPATLGQYLMAGTAFWKWAIKYDAAWREEYKDKVNPFIGHDLPQGGGSETAGKDREIYTRADTLKLHQAALDNGDKPLADLIALGWYTGARIEELCRLNNDSVITVDGIRCFDFPKSKSKASKRVVPIHPSLTTTIDRLCEETTDTFLIPTSSHDHYGKRSHAISKAFGRLRTAAGFSKLHVFHSFRHTVITELVRADVPDALAKELVGHETGSVTHDVYSKGASTAQKLAAISKLPSLKTELSADDATIL